MSDYIKATNFATKDTLLTGNPNKIIKGTEIDTEFNAVASAVASKSDINSPTFTGVPAAPTAAAATNTTQLATTAFVFNERTNTSTLTNKTLTSPTINTPTINTPTISGGSISDITDLSVADGGTGASSFTANNILLGNGTSTFQTVAPGNSGNTLISNGTTWVSAAGFVGHQGQLFTSSGTFTVPEGITKVKVSLTGGGGGGAGGHGSSTVGGDGTDGGNTSFGTHVINNGGGKGFNANGGYASGTTGARTGVQYMQGVLTNNSTLIAYGVGGAGGGSIDGLPSGGSGGTNYLFVGFVTGLTPGETITVTVGSGGSGGANGGGGAGNGTAGTAGVCLVEW
jgi:hypothetical protein